MHDAILSHGPVEQILCETCPRTLPCLADDREEQTPSHTQPAIARHASMASRQHPDVHRLPLLAPLIPANGEVHSRVRDEEVPVGDLRAMDKEVLALHVLPVWHYKAESFVSTPHLHYARVPLAEAWGSGRSRARRCCAGSRLLRSVRRGLRHCSSLFRRRRRRGARRRVHM